MRRYIHAAIFLCTCQSKHMIIFIDRTANCTQRIVAISQDIRNRKFFQSGCSRSLYNTDKCNVVRCQLIKLNLQPFHIARCIVRFQNAVSHRLLYGFLSGYLLSGLLLHLTRIFCNLCSIQKIYAFIVKFYHILLLLPAPLNGLTSFV